MIKVSFKKKLITSQGPLDLSVRFEFQSGEMVSLFGESGVGKTTVLRILSGLTKPDEGFIQYGEETWFDSERRINVPVQNRRIGYVFQEQRLFPNMTVRQNLEYVIRDKKDQNRIDEFLQLMDLKELEGRLTQKLSGGQKQKVSLIRALLYRPKILLLDEAFSAIDVNTRFNIQDRLLALQKQMQITTVLVTHDLGEVFRLSEKTFVLENGQVSRYGRPHDVFTENNISGKFKFIGQILSFIKDGLVNIVTVQVGQNLVKVVVTDDEIQDLKVGEKIIVSSKAFNPIILKSNI